MTFWKKVFMFVHKNECNKILNFIRVFITLYLINQVYKAHFTNIIIMHRLYCRKLYFFRLSRSLIRTFRTCWLEQVLLQCQMKNFSFQIRWVLATSRTFSSLLLDETKWPTTSPLFFSHTSSATFQVRVLPSSYVILYLQKCM